MTLASDGEYLQRMVNYIGEAALERTVKTNNFLADVTVSTGRVNYPINGEQTVTPASADPSFVTPDIPRKIDDNSFESMRNLHNKIIVPMIGGVRDLMDDLFPCNEDLFLDEITALERMLEGGHNADLNTLMDTEQRQAKDTRMIELLAALEASASAASRAGFTIMPGSAVRSAHELQNAAMKQGATSAATQSVERIQGEVDLVKRAIEQILEYRRQLLSAIIGYIGSKIAAAGPALGIVVASTQQQTRLINAVAGYMDSLRSADELRLRSQASVQNLIQQITLSENQRKFANLEQYAKYVSDVTSILASQAAAALNGMSAQGSVNHSVR